MTCKYCNKEITTSSVVSAGEASFCNELHRYWWQQSVSNTPLLPKQNRVRRTSPWIKKASLIAIIPVVFAVTGAVLGTKFIEAIFSNFQSVDKTLMDIASEYNKALPIMVDRDTRLDHMMIMPGKTIVYTYTLVNVSGDEIDLSSLREYQTPRMINYIRTTEDMRQLRAMNVNFEYKYYDAQNRHLLSIRIAPSQYQ